MTVAELKARINAVRIALPWLCWHLARAWVSLEPPDWSPVADYIGAISSAWPHSFQLKRLHARVLRAARRSQEAIDTCHQALALRPENPSALLELGRALRQAGQRDAALNALARAADMGMSAARKDLCRYGARESLPTREPGEFARQDYAVWIDACPPPPPPMAKAAVLFEIRIAGMSDKHAATVTSLNQQVHRGWFLTGDAPPGFTETGLAVYRMELATGAVLDPNCLAWFNYVIAMTGCDQVRADHDYRTLRGERCHPVFLPPCPDALWTEGEDSIVVLAAHRADRIGGSICHVPFILLTMPWEARAPAPNLPDADPRPLSVVIPTRDNPDMLAAAITSLRHTASRSDLLEVVIVDNGSRTPQARALLDRLSQDPGVRIVPFDAEFNWSRASNLGAGAATGEKLLFLNDDTVMQTSGWDRIVAGLFTRTDIGLVGARMVYPDGAIQHGGFVFGMDSGPEHEGRWMQGSDAGPGNRWVATRQAAAVTGAFMAVRTADFVALGGFDEQTFAIDFADLDLCLRVRAQGKAVAYCGAISLIHHESISRGLNIGRRKRRRMRKEWQSFKRRWGRAAIEDPGYHPAWSRSGASYDGLVVSNRAQPQAEQLVRYDSAIWSLLA